MLLIVLQEASNKQEFIDTIPFSRASTSYITIFEKPVHELDRAALVEKDRVRR